MVEKRLVMDNRSESKKRLSVIWQRTRAIGGVSQEYMAQEMGVARKTIQNWEKGVSSPDLEQGFRWFEVLGINPMQYVYDYVFPEIKAQKENDEVEKLRTALVAIVSTLPEESVRQLLYILYCDHGSSPRAAINLFTAHLQTPLRDRITQAGVILKNYQIASNRGMTARPDKIQPNTELVQKALKAGEEAIYRNAKGYLIRTDSPELEFSIVEEYEDGLV